MNFITAGFQEIERKFQRTEWRIRLRLERARLEKAEIDLGALGWQQADFPPEVEKQIDAINRFESQQAELSNQSADLQWQIDELESTRQEKGREFAGKMGELEPVLEPLVTSSKGIKKQIVEKQTILQRFDQAISELEISQAKLEEDLKKLWSAESGTMDIKNQIFQMSEKRNAFEVEREELQHTRLKTMAEIKELTQELSALDESIEQLNTQIRALKDEFHAQDRELNVQIQKLTRQKREARKHVDKLDKKKSPAYLAIGRCLADYNIAPLNQPAALETVLVHRENCKAHLYNIEQSLSISAMMNPALARMFYIFLFVILVAVVAAVVIAEKRG